MIFAVAVIATAIAALGHTLGWPPFTEGIAVPVTGVIAMCCMGVIGRLIPDVRRDLIAMVPPQIPTPGAVVWATGACELLGAIGLLASSTRSWAAGALILLLVCVFPANVRDAHLKGDNDGSADARVRARGAQQFAYLVLCAWILVASL